MRIVPVGSIVNRNRDGPSKTRVVEVKERSEGVRNTLVIVEPKAASSDIVASATISAKEIDGLDSITSNTC